MEFFANTAKPLLLGVTHLFIMTALWLVMLLKRKPTDSVVSLGLIAEVDRLIEILTTAIYLNGRTEVARLVPLIDLRITFAASFILLAKNVFAIFRPILF